jgi:hypothetical protein
LLIPLRFSVTVTNNASIRSELYNAI